jgi:DEAD/DEAH box helicase domain-containing protein
MASKYFSALLPQLSTRAARSTISKLGFSNPPLRRHLLDAFARSYGETGSFLGTPMFEATFGWKHANVTMDVLGKDLLHPSVVSALDNPFGEGKEKDNYRLPRSSRPYTHQLAAWQALLAPEVQSVVVTSGTGSGKTECFMVPVLTSVARAIERERRVEGVRALFLYPLNALIQSQRERLRAWTGPFNGDMRFCLYNGMTPEKHRADAHRGAPNEVLDRATLRAAPPPILVTNPTMLEYMLVRAQDAPIIEKSQGKLEWIVLDEAHNYIGSQAAELALLLRRVLHAFGTAADKVRFVATSATIGSSSEEARQQLREFVAKLAGVSSDRVVVVEGSRHVPHLTEPIDPNAVGIGCETLNRIDEFPIAEESESGADDLYRALTAHPVARALRDMFIPTAGNKGVQSLSAIKSRLQRFDLAHDDASALAWIDLLTSARQGGGRDAIPFLPLRLHAFHNTLNGIWACVDPNCPACAETPLANERWPFGMVYTDERRRCTCGSPVFPLISCNDCNETFLSAIITKASGITRLMPPPADDIDEFALEREGEDSEQPADAESEAEDTPIHVGTRVLITNVAGRGVRDFVRRETHERVSGQGEDTLELHVQDVTVIDKELVLQCPCCAGADQESVQYRQPRLGAPFLLGNIIPTLLEFCPDGDNPLDKPMRGRRMITFTDSRQGTARTAAQLQQDAERSAVRSAVYRRLVSAASAPPSPEIAGIEQTIAEMIKLREGVPNETMRASIDGMLSKQRETLDKLKQVRPLTYRDLLGWLSTQAQDVSRWMHEYYADSDSQFRDSRGKENLTEILLCREFARRPKRQNSLESMGFIAVRYEKLSAVTARRAAVELAGLTIAEWRDFLKICLDFFVRQRWCLKLPPRWVQWGGNRVVGKTILPPSSLERATSKLVRWPRVLPGQRQNVLVRLLAYVLQVDPETESGRDRIDSLLLTAWDDLVAVDLLQISGDQGRYLDVEDMSFQCVTEAWICPVTRRFLDTTLRGITPFLPAKQLHEGVARCDTFEMPVCDVIAQDFPNEDARVAAARAWADEQEVLAAARIEGLWSNISDRVIEGASYFRTVEHSAQQAGSRLNRYENQFRRGEINLMSCSTTMEMGVDIGGINMVAMNNVPPHPANYLQRAGRAGRRAETRSVALTVCKNNPHDQHVFRHTDWPFVTSLSTPGISLSSPLLVQRHINALLLSKFLRMLDRQGKLDKLTMEWWMLPRGESRQERFAAWCECFDGEKHAGLLDGLRALMKRTVFEGHSETALLKRVAEMTREHANHWLLEYQAIEQQIAELSKRDSEDQIPLKALTIQRKRLTAEYLLREMATRGVLPGYGFPTDITSFETLNKNSAEITRARDSAGEGGREDNRFQRRELPSRDTVTALREYAPGASVVIDGLVYQSEGITLNWHAPATQDQINELQNIRQAWRCRQCGSSGTHVLAARLTHCPDCASPLQFASDGECFKRYLEPAGFSVDLYGETHNDIAHQTYIPVAQPWISGEGHWMPLANPMLGRFRASPEGSVFHYSAGLGGAGYALCLECGRAAPMGYKEAADDLPAVFKKPHKRLRGRQGGGGDWICGGSDNPYKIQRSIYFGREYATDVLELNLYDEAGHPLTSPTVAYTIAVALRRAIADHLGVGETELGCDSKEIRDDEGRRVRALQIFDVRSAGYSSLVAPDLPKLLRDARANLVCEQDCDSACQSCLLSYDTRFRADSLDRRAALDFLCASWIDALALPENERLFGELSQAEYQPIQEAITREVNGPGARRLYVYLHGAPEEWDLPASPIKALLHRLSANHDIGLCLVSAHADLSALTAPNAAVIRSLGDVCSVEIKVGTPPALIGEGYCVASVELSDGSCRSWAMITSKTVHPDMLWGTQTERPLIRAFSTPPALRAEVICLPAAEPVSGGRTVELTRELDGSGNGFGQRFWALLGGGVADGVLPHGKTVSALSYEDRYLSTPLACGLLVDVISALKAVYEANGEWDNPRVSVTSMLIDEERTMRYRGRWNSDWTSTQLRDDALRAAFDYCGIQAKVESKGRHALIHGRRLSIHFTDGTQVIVVPDQGMSYWTVPQALVRQSVAGFDMDGESAAQLGEALAEIRISIVGADLPTLISTDRTTQTSGTEPSELVGAG